MVEVAGDLARALDSNYSEFPNSCPRIELLLGEDGLQVLVHGRHSDLEQLGDERLRQPDRLVLEPALDPGATVLGLVENH